MVCICETERTADHHSSFDLSKVWSWMLLHVGDRYKYSKFRCCALPGTRWGYSSLSLIQWTNHEKNLDLYGMSAILPLSYSIHRSCSILNTARPSGRLAHWALTLQKMNITIGHKSGKKRTPMPMSSHTVQLRRVKSQSSVEGTEIVSDGPSIPFVHFNSPGC